MVSVVWWTAASTLFASLPHIECRCPDGRLKVICLLSFVAPAACCSPGESTPDEEPPYECCGSMPDQGPISGNAHEACGRDRDLPRGPSHLQPSGCRKQLVQPGLGILSYTDATETRDAGPALLGVHVLSPHAASLPLPLGMDARLCRSHFRVPPDLIVVLQHFLI